MEAAYILVVPPLIYSISAMYISDVADHVVTAREKCLENEIFPRSGKSQGILWMAREI